MKRSPPCSRRLPHTVNCVGAENEDRALQERRVWGVAAASKPAFWSFGVVGEERGAAEDEPD